MIMKAINNNTDKVIQHTKGKWEGIYNGYPIGEMYLRSKETQNHIINIRIKDFNDGEQKKADLEHIVKCCNSHDALISTLDTILSNFKVNLSYGVTLTNQELEAGISIIEAALKTTE